MGDVLENEYKTKKDKFKVTGSQNIECKVEPLSDEMSYKVKIDLLSKNLCLLKEKINLMTMPMENLKIENRELRKRKITELNITKVFDELKKKRSNQIKYELREDFNTNSRSFSNIHINDIKLIENDKILINCNCCAIELWDINKKICIKEFRKRQHISKCFNLSNALDRNSICILTNSFFAIGNATISIWNVNSSECTRELNSKTTCLKLIKTGYLVSGCDSGEIFKWNYINGKKVQ